MSMYSFVEKAFPVNVFFFAEKAFPLDQEFQNSSILNLHQLFLQAKLRKSAHASFNMQYRMQHWFFFAEIQSFDFGSTVLEKQLFEMATMFL